MAGVLTLVTSDGPAAAYADASDIPRRRRPWLIPGILLVVLIAMLVAVVSIAQRANDSGAPASPDAFVAPDPAFPTVPYDIQQRSPGGNVTIAATDGATFDVNLSAVPVEVLEPIALAEIEPGARVNVIGRPNAVRNFVITSVVALPEGGSLADGDAGYRSAAGFQGWEADRDQALRPVIAGTVTEASASAIVLETVTGAVTVRLSETENANTPLIYRLSEDTELQIDSGDRLALAGVEEGDPETADAALVQPANP